MYVSATSSRFSRGRSTPTKRANVTPSWFRRSVRATFPVGPRPPTEGGVLANRWCAWDGPGAGRPVLALALLVAQFRADHPHDSAATNDLAVVADLLDARLYLHHLFLVRRAPELNPAPARMGGDYLYR